MIAIFHLYFFLPKRCFLKWKQYKCLSEKNRKLSQQCINEVQISMKINLKKIHHGKMLMTLTCELIDGIDVTMYMTVSQGSTAAVLHHIFILHIASTIEESIKIKHRQEKKVWIRMNRFMCAKWTKLTIASQQVLDGRQIFLAFFLTANGYYSEHFWEMNPTKWRQIVQFCKQERIWQIWLWWKKNARTIKQNSFFLRVSSGASVHLKKHQLRKAIYHNAKRFLIVAYKISLNGKNE